tara:strand:+ start:157 stop:831 length:675 start_codon:yes stop_codon:yes gene_type:complete
MIKIYLKSIPFFFKYIAFFRQTNKKILVNKKTDIAIEGFWRCGNHFAVHAFLFSQKKQMVVAHHFHASAQIKMAVKLNIPAIILIRNPYDCIASSLVFSPDKNPLFFIKYYKVFYNSLEKIKHKCIISDFKNTTENFDKIIELVNRKYKSDFEVFDNQSKNINIVLKNIKNENIKSMNRNLNDEIAIPSDYKKKLKSDIIALLKSNYKKEMKELYNIYDQFIQS